MIVTVGGGIGSSVWRGLSYGRRIAAIASATQGPSNSRKISAIPQIQKSGLTLTNPDDLYMMTRFLREEYYDKGNHLYPIKTMCDGELIETEIYCPFEPKLSPHYTRLYNTRDDRSKLYSIPPDSTNMEKYNRINCEKLGSLMAPSSTYQDTEMVAMFYSMMYYLNDQTAHLKLPEEDIQPELVDELNDHLLQYLGVFLSVYEPQDVKDLDRIWNFLDFYQPYFQKTNEKIILNKKYDQRKPPQIGLIVKITDYIRERSESNKNVTQIIFEVIRYIKGIKQEIKIRGDKKFRLNLKEYDNFRDQVTSSPMAHSITDLTKDDFCYKIYTNPRFEELENLTSEIITYTNDVCTCDRERMDADPFNSVFILRDLHSLSYAASCELVVKFTQEKLDKFLATKKLLLDRAHDDEEHKAISQMIRNREDSLIGYLVHEICCVTPGYARDHKPMMKEYLEKNILIT